MLTFKEISFILITEITGCDILINKVVGYRKMLSMTQKDMAEKLGLSEGQYRAKEKGKYPFRDYEMQKFHDVVREKIKNVKITDIFFM